MKPSRFFLSIIIPLFNEEKRLAKTFVHLRGFLKTHTFSVEIIFVDDGSKDNSKFKVQSLKKELENQKVKIKIISYQPNYGKGHAVKQGVLRAKGKWILIVDADMSIPLSTFALFKKYLKIPHVMIVGNRNDASRKNAQQSTTRRFLSRGFRSLSFFLTQVDATDITCGFKCFERKTAKKLFSQLTIKRWAYDTQLFYLAKKLYITPTPVPIEWKEDIQTRVNIGSAMIGSLIDLVKIKFSPVDTD